MVNYFISHLKVLWAFRRFFLNAVFREIRSRYLNSRLGVLWLLLTPFFQLLIYYFVFEKIFKIRFADYSGQSFIAFVALGLWPWVAFSEALSTGTMAIDKHQALLKKIALPRALLVLIEVTVSHVIHWFGFLFVLFLLLLFDSSLSWQALYYLPFIFCCYLIQLIFCFALALVLSALQVYLKDVAQILSPLLMVWFYLTPIIYPTQLIPDFFKPFLALNPLAILVASYRQLLQGDILQIFLPLTLLAGISLLLLGLAFAFFSRLSRRFEDLF